MQNGNIYLVILSAITLASIFTIIIYSKGYNEGKRDGYHRGRSISFNKYNEISK